MTIPTFCLIACSLGLLQGCAQTGEKPASVATQAVETKKTVAEKPAPPDAAALSFSTMPSMSGRTEPNNWCRADFTEAVGAFPETAGENQNQYFFLAVTNGVYKVNVRAGNAVASLLVRPTVSGTVEIFTSDNFPECLSNRANHALSESGFYDDYDNSKDISFTLHVQKAGANYHVSLEFPPTVQYGLTVHRMKG